MKKIALLAAAILVLAGGAMVAVYLQSGGPAPSGSEVLPAPPPPPTIPVADLPPQTQADLSRYGSATRPAQPMVYQPPPPPPPVGSWESVKPVARLAALGPLGHSLNRGLASLGPQLGACFDETTQSRFGQTGYTAAKEEYAAVDENGNTIVMLQVETTDGGVRIVDAPVESRGGASDGLLACAQSVLRGQTFAAPGVKAGQRARVVYNLTP